MDLHTRYTTLGWAWVGMAVAIGLHVADEALTGFLAIYNPTVVEARQRWSWFTMPTFTFRTWLAGLIAVILLLIISPMAFRNVRWIPPVGYVVSVLMIVNALGHTLATILGRTFADVRFARPAPGFYSSPVLVIASVYLLVELRSGSGSLKKKTTASGM